MNSDKTLFRKNSIKIRNYHLLSLFFFVCLDKHWVFFLFFVPSKFLPGDAIQSRKENFQKIYDKVVAMAYAYFDNQDEVNWRCFCQRTAINQTRTHHQTKFVWTDCDLFEKSKRIRFQHSFIPHQNYISDS